MSDLNCVGGLLLEAIPEVVSRYHEGLLEAGNPLGTTPELWQESRAHATLMLEACAQLIDQPQGASEGAGPGEDLLACTAMGTLWACCRARLTDSLSAMETLVSITFDSVVDLAAPLPAGERAAVLTRASRVIHRMSSAHTRTAAFSYDRYLLQQIEQANADDRTRLARDIHDRLGNSLVLAFRHLELYQAKLASGAESATDHLAAIQQSLDEATGFTRSLISGLRADGPLTNLPEALKQCADTLNFRKLPVVIEAHGDETWLPAQHRDELFLIVREFLRNSFAHAEPAMIVVQIGISPHRVDVEAHDDGRGFTPGPTPGQHPVSGAALVPPQGGRPDRRGGTGLAAMQERTEQLGGSFFLSSAPGKGTRMRLWVPLPKRGSEPDPGGGRTALVAAA